MASLWSHLNSPLPSEEETASYINFITMDYSLQSTAYQGQNTCQ
jgi:hypothetical protein